MLVITAACLMMAWEGTRFSGPHRVENNISNKKKTVALLKAIETGALEPVAYVNAESKKQHCYGPRA